MHTNSSETKDVSPGPPQRFTSTTAWLIMNVICVVVLVFVTTMICLTIIGGTLLVDADSLYWDDNSSLQDWTRRIMLIAQRANAMTVTAALSIAVISIITTVAAWWRSPTWLMGGAICWTMLAVTLILASTQGLIAVDNVITETHERIGAVSLVPRGTEVDVPNQDPPIPPLSQREVEDEIMRMIDISSAHSTGQLIATDPLTGDQSLDGSTPPFRVESCYSDANGDVGKQVSIKLSIPSDEDGETVQRLVSAWADAGYPSQDQMRSQHFMGSDNKPIRLVSINDHFTIDGLISVRIESACSTPTTG